MNTTLHRALTRSGLAVATLLLTAGGLSACGGSDGGSSGGGSGGDAPDDVSAADFCATYASYIKELTGSFSAGTDIDNLVPTLKKYAADLAELGTPSDIPDDARKGFELSIDAINKLPDDATQADLSAAGAKFSDADNANAEAFSTYVTKTCPDLLPTAPSS